MKTFFTKMIIMKEKSEDELKTINLTYQYVFENPDSPYDGYLKSYFIPTMEDHSADITGLTPDNKPVYVEVKSSSQPLYVNGKMNPYFKLESQPFTFENTTTASTATTGNCPFNRYAYSTTVPDEFKDGFFYYINSATNGMEEEIMSDKCKFKKMLDGGWAFSYVLQDGILFFSPKTFREALGPFVRRWSRNTNNWSPKIWSWELKKLVDLEKGTWIPFN